MLRQDWTGNYRFYVRGVESKLIDFTVDLTWNHSALAHIASTNRMDDGTIVLNLIVSIENYGNNDVICEHSLRNLAEKYSLVAFATWDEYKEREGA